MNKFVVTLVFALIFGMILFSGYIQENASTEPNIRVTEIQTQQESPPIAEPEETLNKYVFSFNNLQTEYLYNNLLSAELKKKKSEDEVHNLIYAYKLQQIKITRHNVISKTITRNAVNMDIEFVWDVQGFRKTVSKNVTLLLEENKWKIDGDIITM